MLKCGPDEPALPLGEAFWKAYDLAGRYFEVFAGSRNTQSLEVRARNNLLVAMSECEKRGETGDVPFMRMLLEDIRLYGTLPDYTLRKLAMTDLQGEIGKLTAFLDAVKGLETVLGFDYLQKLKMRLGRRTSEIIISEEIKQDMESAAKG